jgi:hypothetical protein
MKKNHGRCEKKFSLFITHQGPHTCNQFNGSNLNPHPKAYTIQIYLKK